MSDSPVDGQQAEHDNRFVVDNVDLVGDGSNGQPCAGGQERGLGYNVVAGQAVKDRSGLVLGVLLWDIGLVAGLNRGAARERRKGLH